MRIACWIPKATNTHSEYVILIAFPQQQWLYERVSMLRHTYIAACLITFEFRRIQNEVCVYLKRSLKSVYPSFSHVKSQGNDANTYSHFLLCLLDPASLI